MSGLLLIFVPWYTSIRPMVMVTTPMITLSARGGHGPPDYQKASKASCTALVSDPMGPWSHGG